MTTDVNLQTPCAWCAQPTDPAACLCRMSCGASRCPYTQEFSSISQPVPEFANHLRALAGMVAEAAPPKKLVEVAYEDPRAAVERVLALHCSCQCAGCQTTASRPSCKGCNEYWPCPTVNAVRGISMRLADLA